MALFTFIYITLSLYNHWGIKVRINHAAAGKLHHHLLVDYHFSATVKVI